MLGQRLRQRPSSPASGKLAKQEQDIARLCFCLWGTLTDKKTSIRARSDAVERSYALVIGMTMRPAVQCMGIFSTPIYLPARKTRAHVGYHCVRHSARNRLVFLTYSYDVAMRSYFR